MASLSSTHLLLVFVCSYHLPSFKLSRYKSLRKQYSWPSHHASSRQPSSMLQVLQVESSGAGPSSSKPTSSKPPKKKKPKGGDGEDDVRCWPLTPH